MAVDLSAIAKWPNVPACYDWLSLDRRGDWRLQGERVSHRGLIDFINRQYGCDEAGNWFLQNGPQRVYVSLACAPWVFRREAAGWLGHTGQPAGAVKAIHVDEEGNVLLATELGIGLLDDRDLAQFLAECTLEDGRPADEAAFLALLAGGDSAIRWHDIPMDNIAAADLPQRYGFIATPRPLNP
jgi:hypothetical protein